MQPCVDQRGLGLRLRECSPRRARARRGWDLPRRGAAPERRDHGAGRFTAAGNAVEASASGAVIRLRAHPDAGANDDSIYRYDRRGLLTALFEGGQRKRDQQENFAFENTEKLVIGGIFRYIRHPMYASLLFLAWGGLCKNLTVLGLGASLVATLALLLTGLVEERENLAFFGAPYRDYMGRSKRFIPFVF